MFGMEHGRFIARYPRDWKRMVDERLTEQLSLPRPMKAARMIEWLKTPAGQRRDLRFVRVSTDYEPGSDWLSNASRCHESFDWIISGGESPAANLIRADETTLFAQHEAFAPRHNLRIPRDEISIARELAPIAEGTKHLKWIDAYFTVLGESAAYHTPFLALLLEQLNAPTGAVVPVVEFHRLRRIPNDPQFRSAEEFRNAFRQELALLKGGYNVILKVFFWKHLHARYFLSGHAGAELDLGMGRGIPGKETTSITLLPEASRACEWNRHSVPSTDLTIDAACDVMEIR